MEETNARRATRAPPRRAHSAALARIKTRRSSRRDARVRARRERARGREARARRAIDARARVRAAHRPESAPGRRRREC